MFRMTSENVHNDILSRHTRHQSVMLVPTFPVMPVPTFLVMAGLTGHHSFFSASAGFVHAARRVCQRTEAMVTANEIRTQRI